MQAKKINQISTAKRGTPGLTAKPPIWLRILLILLTAAGILSVLLFLFLTDSKDAAVDLIKTFISWPVAIVIILLILHRPLSTFIENLGQNFQTVKLSILQFALEVSRASQF